MTTLDLDALERAARAKAELGFNSWAFNPNAILSLISDYRALQERVEGAEKARPQTWGEWERAQQEKERGA